MIYLVGSTFSHRMLAEMRPRGIGRMMVERFWEPGEDELWALDNGAFLAARHGTEWDLFRFTDRLGRLQDRTPLFAVLPDRAQVNGGEATAAASLRRSHLFWMLARQLEVGRWRWLLPVQDGMTVATIEELLAEPGGLTGIGGLFLGGSNAFKWATAPMWCHWCHERGLWFHFARCGTVRKLAFARAIGCDSGDSALVLRSRGQWETFLAQIDDRVLPGQQFMTVW